MDEGTFVVQLLGHVNIVAVAFAITLTSLLKFFLLREKEGTALPLPGPAPGTPKWKAVLGRLLPILPIFFAVFYAGAVRPPNATVAQTVNSGVVSGAVAGYAYRVWKVTLLGK